LYGVSLLFICSFYEYLLMRVLYQTIFTMSIKKNEIYRKRSEQVPARVKAAKDLKISLLFRYKVVLYVSESSFLLREIFTLPA